MNRINKKNFFENFSWFSWLMLIYPIIIGIIFITIGLLSFLKSSIGLWILNNIVFNSYTALTNGVLIIVYTFMTYMLVYLNNYKPKLAGELNTLTAMYSTALLITTIVFIFV